MPGTRGSFAAWVCRHSTGLLLVALAGWYLLATVPYLNDFPVMEWAQMRIITPAYKLAADGIYGNDLLTGFYNAERRNYEYMPLYPLQVALAFSLLGPGIWQARAVSVLGGLLCLLLTFALGRYIHSQRLGLLAVGALVVPRLALPVPGEVNRIGIDLNASGIPLLDLARVVRFDIWVPVWVLSACLCFFWAQAHGSRPGYAASGALAGAATLTHAYGAFILVVLVVVLLWTEGARIPRRAPLYLMASGWLVAMLPWVVYVLGDLESYRGQMAKHGTLADILRPGYYLDNLLREPWRYLAWIGGSFRRPILWPRPGLWLLVAGVGLALLLLWRQARTRRSPSDVFLLTAWPVLALLLAVLVHYKRSYYVLLVLPLLALQVAYAVQAVWEQTRLPPTLGRAALGLILAAVAVEGALGVGQSWQAARATTPYAALSGTIGRAIHPGARVLLAEPYWLGLVDHQARSIQLPFLLADQRYFPRSRSLPEVLLSLQPEYVVTEERLLDIYGRDPDQVSENAQNWRMLDAFLRQHCPLVAAELRTADYGDVRVYRCGTAVQSSSRPGYPASTSRTIAVPGSR
jgi:4-amino-4-deoxy-L-arabinose transferase-like glycosyltransferase